MTKMLQRWPATSLTPVRRVAAFVVLGLTAGAAAFAAPASEPMTKITISYSEKVGDNLPLWIAVDAGYFRQRGLDVTARYLPAREGIPALLSGQVQLAAIGGANAVAAAAQGAKLKFVANFSPVYTFQFWARPQYTTAKALKGQRVGVSSTTGSLYTATVLSLRALGLAPSDVAITPLGSVPNVNNALLAGSIVAASSHPPITYRYQQNGFVDLVDLAKKRIPNINTGLLTLDPYIKSNPKIVAAVVEAIVEALQREKSDKAFAETELRRQMGVDQQAVLDFTYDFYANEVAPTLPLPEASQLEGAKEALAVSNAKAKAVDLASLIDQSFVKAAATHLKVK